MQATSEPVRHESDERASRIQRTIVNVLRVSVALQAIGVGLQRLGFDGIWEDESPVFGLLLFDWQWPEATAQRVDDVGSWLYLICGVALVLLPLAGYLLRKILGKTSPIVPNWTWQVPLCLIVAIWQTVLTVVAWHRGGFFMSEWELASESARVALPVAIIVLTSFSGASQVSARRMSIAVWILRVAACLTFVGHGLKSCCLSPDFINYLLSATERVSWDVSESAAKVILRAIGVVDLVLAALIVTTRWRAVAFYMAGWALIAALARMVQAGWGAHFEVLVRAGNYCVPFVVGLYWQLSRRPPSPTAAQQQEPTDE